MHGENMFIDTHAHLQDQLYPNLKDVLENAKQNNVQKIICASYDLNSSILSCNLSEEYEEKGDIMEKKVLGRIGEEMAARILEKSGYRIIARNFRCCDNIAIFLLFCTDC